MSRIGKIVIAGGSGQIGSAIIEHFAWLAAEMVVLSRNANLTIGNVRTVMWDGRTAGAWRAELEGADMLINLVGKNVNCRHTKSNREAIISSRVDAVRALAQAARSCKAAPALWIQAASVAIYPHHQYRPMTEEDSSEGTGFMAEVCRVWEDLFKAETKELVRTRKIILRFGMVLGKTDGAFPRLKNLVRLGLGGKAGSGQQYVSWVHEDDVVRVVEWIVFHTELEGPVNCTSPGPLTNTELMRALRREVRMPVGLPAPEILVRLGAFAIGTAACLVLDSVWALPAKLTRSGFEFGYPRLDKALEQLMKK